MRVSLTVIDGRMQGNPECLDQQLEDFVVDWFEGFEVDPRGAKLNIDWVSLRRLMNLIIREMKFTWKAN